MNTSENPDWLKKVGELQVFVASKASGILRALGPGDKEALKQLLEGAPILTSSIQDLTNLQQCRLNDIDKSYQQLELDRTALSRKAAAVQKQTHLLNKWTAYKDEQTTKAQAACQEASEEKVRLSNALESMQKQMELLEGRNADDNQALSTAKERNLRLTEQLEDLNATTKSLEAAWEDNAKLQQLVSGLREETKQYRPCKDDFERSKRLQLSSLSTINDLDLRLQECKQELGNVRAQVVTDIGLHSEALATKDDIINDLHSSMNATERERYVSNGACAKTIANVGRLFAEHDILREEADLEE